MGGEVILDGQVLWPTKLSRTSQPAGLLGTQLDMTWRWRRQVAPGAFIVRRRLVKEVLEAGDACLGTELLITDDGVCS